MQAYVAVMRRYARFQGRTARGDYWRFNAVFFGIAILGAVLDHNLGTANRDGELFIGLVWVVHALPLLAAGVRRLHDTDHSGWWLLVSPVAFVFACLPGTAGPNRFGPVPTSAGADGRHESTLAHDGAGKPAASNPAPMPAPAPIAPYDPIAELERLAQLRASGSLSEAEFAVMKARALNAARGA